MKIKEGFVIRDIAGDTVVIATGEISKTFHGMIKLNSTGKEIWEILSSGDFSEDEVVAEMAKRHDAKAEEISEGVIDFISKIREAGLFE